MNNSNRMSPQMHRQKHKGVLGRTLKALFKFYPVMTTIALVCIIVNAVISALPSIFMERIFSIVGDALAAQRMGYPSGWAVYGGEITKYMLTLIGLYVVSLVMGAVDKQLMAIVTQGFL